MILRSCRWCLVALAFAVQACGDSPDGMQDDLSNDIAMQDDDALAESDVEAEEAPTSLAFGHDTSDLEDVCGLDTGFPGDEFCLLPPDSEEGFQLHLGPTDYDDQQQIDNFSLAPGEEMTRCVWERTPNDTLATYYKRKIHMRPVSHHVFLFSVPESALPSGVEVGSGQWNRCGDFSAFNGAIGGAEVPRVEYPQGGIYPPEMEGAYKVLASNALIRMEMHAVNTTDQAVLRELWVNVFYLPREDATKLIQDVYQLGGLNVMTPPGVNETMTVTQTINGPSTVLNLYGHMHGHGVRFSAWRIRDGESLLILEDYDWFDPIVIRYDSITENSPPDRDNQIPGGYSGVLEFEEGDQLQWQCEVHNDSDVTLTFRNEAFRGEMCNIFGEYMTPEDRTTSLTNAASFGLFGTVERLN